MEQWQVEQEHWYNELCKLDPDKSYIIKYYRPSETYQLSPPYWAVPDEVELVNYEKYHFNYRVVNDEGLKVGIHLSRIIEIKPGKPKQLELF